MSDFAKLQQYMYEPYDSKKPVKGNHKGKEYSDSEEDTSRFGNTLWCSCGKFRPMATYAESICCLDKYEICESYLKGILSFVSEIFLSRKLLLKGK